MKKPPASLYTLVIGIGLGFLITQSTNQTSPERDGNAPAPDGRTSSPPRRGPSSRTSPAGKARAGAQTSVSGSLASLLHLTSINYGAPDSIAFMTAIEALGGDDIASILIDLEDVEKGDPRQYRIRNALFNRWAKVDPEGAWDAARQLKDKSVRSQMIANVIGAITRADPSKARQLLADIKDPQSKQQALQAFVANAATEDPEGALQVLTSEMKSSQSNYQYQTLFHLWAKEDPEGALAKLNEVKGAQNRQMALSGIATALATSDPERAVAFANEIANLGERNNTLNSVVGTLASTNPQRALEILDGMPPGQ